ncbi:hypothetical protein QB691_000112 [Escherichia coli]|uniref:hypothetical protein n=1 Tax=Escherichia coli TaxID=562 RepID=UPI001020C5BA|nr:hypothetical protein [Escherichia coli]EKS5466246.1 hypothetical protein [Escherichia coli]
MKEWAVVENGIVVNVVLWDGISEWHAGEDQEVIEVVGDSQAGIGWTYSGGEFVPPPELEVYPEDATPATEV